ncbi:MAG: FAD-dependent oxidoreductase [Acholeplasmataceae bacterium]|jgi:sarcosine oxidase subunit alpha|nr:FAD-dependent oxidoreductase [Acholeplasmataceae bacterium]
MIEKELVIIGGGPAGLAAARLAAEAGVEVLIIDRMKQLGGQLVKQTHKFFGSKKQYAKFRGIEIAEILSEAALKLKVEVLAEAVVLGIYPDKVLTVLKGEEYIKIKAQAIIIATGASEKVLAFENNDLPGVYGAGAVQTLMNVHGVRPGSRMLMVGSGNIGLIVSYQLMQAGIEVAAVIEASPQIGGYLVHAAKLRRLGVPIITSCTIKKALGSNSVQGAITVRLDEAWQEIPGTETTYEVDGICIAVGLSPLSNLLAMAECRMKYIGELGGLVPILDSSYQTSQNGIFACGDVSGIEEASSAMVEGGIAGLSAAHLLGKVHPQYDELLIDYKQQLSNLRSGPGGVKIRKGLQKMETL